MPSADARCVLDHPCGALVVCLLSRDRVEGTDPLYSEVAENVAIPLAGWVSRRSGTVAMRVTGIRSLYGS